MTADQRAPSVLVELCCVILLTVATVRLFHVNRTLFAEIDAAQARLTSVPPSGSLGNLLSPQTSDRSVTEYPYLVLFVIHSNTIKNDVTFWNAVEMEIRRTGLNVQLVGVCDNWRECDGQQESAAFRLVGLLDPYQAHILATADRDGDALLYNGNILVAQLRSSNEDASAIAVAVREAMN